MTVNDHPQELPFTLHELGSPYADAGDRYVVSLIASDGDHEATSPADAVAHTQTSPGTAMRMARIGMSSTARLAHYIAFCHAMRKHSMTHLSRMRMMGYERLPASAARP